MNSRPKPAIFVFTTAYEPFIGGAEIAIAETVKRLRNEFRFFIFTSRFRPNLPRAEERDGVVIRRIGLGFSFDKFLLPFLGFFVVGWYTLRERPALFWGVMVSFASGIPYLINLTRLAKPIPLVLTLQEGDSIEHISGAKLGLVGFSWKKALRRTQYLTAISTFLLNAAKEFGYKGGARVIPNGVDTTLFNKEFMADELKLLRGGLGISSDERVIVTTSRLVEKNAVDIVIRALGVMIKKNRKIKFLVLGDGGLKEELRELSRREGVERQVLFLGVIPHAEVPKYLKIADIFVRPSRSEGLGNSFIEAMAAGLPVIGTMVGGIPDFLEDGKTGLAVRVDDAEDLAEKIEKVLDDASLRERLREGGRRIAFERFGWEMIAGEFRVLFNKLSETAAKLHILIATPIFPPSVGGPAVFAENLYRAFIQKDYYASVLTYGGGMAFSSVVPEVKVISSRWPSGIKHLAYFIRVFLMLLKADAVIALDTFIVGLPVLLAARLLQKKIALRIEGDFLWEIHIERTGQDLTLKGFYETFSSKRLSPKEKIVFLLSHFVVRHVDALIFSSNWRKDIFDKSYPVPAPMRIISPPWPEISETHTARERVIIYAGRFIKAKNLQRLISVFSDSDCAQFRLELVGDGPDKDALQRLVSSSRASDRISISPPLTHAELLKSIASSYAFALPSLSEVGPNVILDCIKMKTPFLLTRETGFYETLKDVGLFVNPLDDEELKGKLQFLCDEKNNQEYQRRLGGFERRHSWEEIADEWLAVLSDSTKNSK